MMKKMAVVIAMALLCTLTACRSEKGKVVAEDSEEDKKQETILETTEGNGKQEEESSVDGYENITLGLRMAVNSNPDMLLDEEDLREDSDSYGYLVCQFENTEELFSVYEKARTGEMSQEEWQQYLDSHSGVCTILYVMTEEAAADFREGKDVLTILKETYPGCGIDEQRHNGLAYFLVDYMGMVQKDLYGEAEWKRFENVHDSFLKAYGQAEFFEPQPVSAKNIGRLQFDTFNLKGEQVTDRILADRQITIVNVWATWCKPCVNEMPELAAWEKELPENVQILYLCSDLSLEDEDSLERTKKIAEETGINPENVLYWTADMEPLMTLTDGFPTTFFVHSDGTLYSDMMIGANVPGYKEILGKLMGQ